MNSMTRFRIVGTLAGCVLMAIPVRAAEPAHPADATGHMIVMVQPGVMPVERGPGVAAVFCERADDTTSATAQRMGQFLDQHGFTSVEPYLSNRPDNRALAARVGLDRMFKVRLGWGTVTAQTCALFESQFAARIQFAIRPARGRFLSLEPNDPLYPQQWNLHNIGQETDDFGETPYECDDVTTLPPGFVDADMDLPEAWLLETGSDSVLVAVIDTGADLDHPELIGNLVPGHNFIPGEDPENAQDSVVLSHGTAISGIIAAETNNGIGLAGICWNCQVMPLRIGDWSDWSYFEMETCAEALVWATDLGADVANMSWGLDASTHPDVYKEFGPALAYAIQSGVILVAAVGNFGPEAPISYPASDPQVIGVGASTVTDELACFSHIGPSLSVVAPGVNYPIIWSDEVMDEYPFCPGQSYCLGSGTSYSTANVVGVAALIRSANEALTPAQVKDLIESTADDLGEPGFDDAFGHGRINAYRAVCEARRMGCPGDVDQDDDVDINDLLAIIGRWGLGAGLGDVNCDDTVGVNDLLEAIGAFGYCQLD